MSPVKKNKPVRFNLQFLRFNLRFNIINAFICASTHPTYGTGTYSNVEAHIEVQIEA